MKKHLADVVIEYTLKDGTYCREEYALLDLNHEIVTKWKNHSIEMQDLLEIDTLPIIWVEKYFRLYEHIKYCVKNGKINVKIA